MLFRQNNTSMVLGTDMKKHFDIMSRFQVCSCSTAVIYASFCNNAFKNGGSVLGVRP